MWQRRPSICRAYDCNTDPLLQVVLRDGFRSLRELVVARPVAAAERVTVPSKGASGQRRPAIVRLQIRVQSERPGPKPGSLEYETAARLRELRLAISSALGRPSVCAVCARGAPGAAGRWEGGRCCAPSPDSLFDDVTIGALVAGGTRAHRLRGPADDDAGCPCRGAHGCSLDAEDRPDACLGYLCGELIRELEGRGDAAVVRSLCADLEREHGTFAALRAMRQLAEALEDDAG
jgi:hypothetical protein